MLKNTITILPFFVLLLSFCNNTNAQSKNDENNYYRRRTTNTESKIYSKLIFCYYPIAALTGNFKIGVERKLSDLQSIKTNIRFGFGDKSSIYNYQTPSNSYYNSNIRNFVMAMLEMQLRYYFSDKAPNGFYGGFYSYYKLANFNYANYNSYNYTTTDASQFLNGGGLGILVGIQNVSLQKIALDVYMGSGMSFTSPEGNNLQCLSGVADRYFNGIGFIVGANVGLSLRK